MLSWLNLLILLMLHELVDSCHIALLLDYTLALPRSLMNLSLCSVERHVLRLLGHVRLLLTANQIPAQALCKM